MTWSWLEGRGRTEKGVMPFLYLESAVGVVIEKVPSWERL